MHLSCILSPEIMANIYMHIYKEFHLLSQPQNGIAMQQLFQQKICRRQDCMHLVPILIFIDKSSLVLKLASGAFGWIWTPGGRADSKSHSEDVQQMLVLEEKAVKPSGVKEWERKMEKREIGTEEGERATRKRQSLRSFIGWMMFSTLTRTKVFPRSRADNPLFRKQRSKQN